MNVHVTYKVPKSPDIEKELNHQIDKISKRLQVFRPELIHLKASLEQNSPREGTLISLNLRLPSGQMAVQQSAQNPTSAIKSAFDDLMQQITRHKELLRSSHKWPRRRIATESPQTGVPFEQTVAAVLPPSISADDIRSYVNANLERLQRFVDRELYFRGAEQDFPENGTTTQEIVDEVIARALGDGERPEKLALEPWLYRLAMDVMNELSTQDDTDSIHLEEARWRRNVPGNDEPALQFHQPDETWTHENTIADRRLTTPEQDRYSDEMLALVQAALNGVDRTDREAFLLYGMEGFSLPEIASITGRHTEAVRESIDRARECIRNAPSVAHEFPQKLLAKTRF